ncbi:low affinity immunoglobulin gamma Fc region receptor II-a-like isoform X9 [Oenanthe melanoleuca]|uniref:low affinity immunoglobulin gamma Fc region receptor II-a-like isoform X9 n=1 Tax=Oenanthe melanoleuca TaxID=2939378 RepID=UPI0024C107DE|nr:low affinity immunoglobulin gamma Fc region receptor II-a-like isoform X9 [Oenanthe melanoleuca]
MAGDTRMAGKVALLLWAQTLSLAGAQSTQLLVEPPWTPAVLWDRVTLTCQCSGTAGATSWYKDGQRWGQEQRHSFTVTESGTYTCGGPGTGRSSPVTVSDVPVANATITPGPPALQMCPGDPVTLRCSVQVGSAPVTFTWLHDGQEVGQGPLLELGAVDVGHSGTYQCVATNQLGQDGHRVFQALSPELALEVTPQGTTGHHWITAVATGFGGSLLFLVLLVGGAVGLYQWNSKTSRKQQERAPTEDGEVLYTHVVSTKQMGVSPCATTLQDPQGCPPCPGDGHEWGIPCGAVQSSPFQCSQLSQYLQGLHIPSSWDTALDLCPTDWTQNSDFELNWKKWFLFVQLCPLSSGWRRVPVRLLSRSLWDLQDFWGSLSPLRKGTK